LAQTFLKRGHEVDYIELGIRYYRAQTTFAKVIFSSEVSAKYYLMRKFVEIDGIQFPVTASTDSYRSKHEYPQSGHGRSSKHDYYQHHYDPEDSRTTPKEKQRNKGPKEPPAEKYRPGEQRQKKEENEGAKRPPLIEKGEPQPSEGLLVQEEEPKPQETAEIGKSPRKLSYKGKDIDFHPKAAVAVVSGTFPPNTEDQKKPVLVTSGRLSPTSSKKEGASIQSKLSPTSQDWNLESPRVLTWADATAHPSKMVYPAYPSVLHGFPISNYGGNSLRRPEVQDSLFEHQKKKEVWIEFYTFPGCA
jgi:hypothetical protein